jgi:hypothetical protein
LRPSAAGTQERARERGRALIERAGARRGEGGGEGRRARRGTNFNYLLQTQQHHLQQQRSSGGGSHNPVNAGATARPLLHSSFPITPSPWRRSAVRRTRKVGKVKGRRFSFPPSPRCKPEKNKWMKILHFRDSWKIDLIHFVDNCCSFHLAVACCPRDTHRQDAGPHHRVPLHRAIAPPPSGACAWLCCGLYRICFRGAGGKSSPSCWLVQGPVATGAPAPKPQGQLLATAR